MKLTEIEAMMAEDSELDEKRLDFESLRIPSLHAKYYRLFMGELQILKGRQISYFSMKREKTEYYLGKSPDEVYKAKPLGHKILKGDLDIYMNADEDLNSLENKMALQKAKTDMVEAYIKSLKERSFTIKTALDFRKFQAGSF